MNDNKKYILDKVLSRIDFYLNVVNVKAAFLITFDTFILGSILLKYSDIINQFNFIKVKAIVVFLIIMMILGVVCSLYKILKAVSPFLQSGNKPSTYQSLLFFGSIAELSNDEYENKIENITEKSLIYDLAQQTHLLSQSLMVKFKDLNRGMWWIIWFTVLPMIVIVILKIIEWFFV